MKKNLIIMALTAAFLAGCIHLPKFSSPSLPATKGNGGPVTAGPTVNLTPVEAAAVADARAGLPEPALTAPEAKVVAKALAAPVQDAPGVAVARPVTTTAVQKTVDTLSGVLCFCALLGVAFGAFLIYSGHLVSGIQFIAGSFGVAIFAVWFALHWLIVASCCLIGAGIFFLSTHYAVVKPLLEKMDSTGGPILEKLEAAEQRAVAWVEKEAKKL